MFSKRKVRWHTYLRCVELCESVLLFSRPRYEGWPHNEYTFSIYLCLLPFWLTLPWWVLFTSWCCPSRLCVVFLACVHLALFLALSLSRNNSRVSSRCDHSMQASLLWQSLIVPSLLQLCWGPTHFSEYGGETSFVLPGEIRCFHLVFVIHVGCGPFRFHRASPPDNKSLAMASIARDLGSSSTNRSSDNALYYKIKLNINIVHNIVHM